MSEKFAVSVWVSVLLFYNVYSLLGCNVNDLQKLNEQKVYNHYLDHLFS